MWHKWISFKKTKYDSSGDPIAIGPIKYDTMSQPTNQINQFNQSTVQPKQATRQCFRNELRNQTNDWRPHCIPPGWDFLWIWTHSCCTSTLKSCQRHYTRHSVRSQSTHSTWVQAQKQVSTGTACEMSQANQGWSCAVFSRTCSDPPALYHAKTYRKKHVYPEWNGQPCEC